MHANEHHALEAALRAEHEARADRLVPNRHERRAIAVLERREAIRRTAGDKGTPDFYGTASTVDVICA